MAAELKKTVVSGGRLRIALLGVVATAVAMAPLYAGAWWAFRAMQIADGVHELNRAILGAKGEIAVAPMNPELNQVQDGFPEVSLYAKRDDGKFTGQFGRLKLAGVSVPDGLTEVNGIPALITTKDIYGFGEVVVAVPWKSREDSAHGLLLTLIGMYLPLCALAGFVTYVASRRTFQPLESLAAQAESFSAGNLSGRLQIERHDEFGAFAERLNRFLEKLEEAVKSEERFVADASHELRTPLTIIRGQIETILLNERDKEEYKTTLLSVLAEAERLSRLVELLLLSTKADPTLQTSTSLRVVFFNLEQRWRQAYQSAKVELVVKNADVQVPAFDEEIDSICDNLLANALRYSTAGTKVFLTAEPSEGGVTIICQDQGPGIDPSLTKTLFDRFSRGDSSRNRATGGFGIGLSVSRRLAERRGGKISLAPSAAGARFEVWLPTLPADALES